MLSIPYGICHSVFSGDFKVYDDFVFVDDLWISRDIAFLTIPYVSWHSVLSDDFKFYNESVFTDDLWQFPASAMTLFFLSI